MRAALRGAVGTLSALLVVGCSPAEPVSEGEPTADARPEAVDHDDPRWDDALSEPREDSYYPDVGDPGVDALHYDLDLTWDPDARRLGGTETLLFRATRTAPTVRLDLGEPLEVGDATLDGEPVDVVHDGKDLVVRAAVTQDSRHVLELTYTGTPEPVRAPTARDDFSTTGWTTTPDGRTWTMQEPYGAHSWYAVNDHPSDKAFYDVAVEVPSPWVGVSNGTLTSRTEQGGTTRTEWTLASPAASYLVTVATGPFTETTDEAAGGVPISYWTLPEAGPGVLERLSVAPRALRWLERRLGPYPFDSLGFVVVDSESGMETQTMITLGDTAYTTSRPVVVHEMIHQWYGDQVTPDDWRDVWMNEGMAMYLQLVWEARHGRTPLDQQMAYLASRDQRDRSSSGPPAAYDRDEFGDDNVYYLPALMWDQLRHRVGDRAFWAMVRAWPEARDLRSTGREDYLDWIEEQTGVELGGFFDAWLLDELTPPVR